MMSHCGQVRFADDARQENATVLMNARVAEATYRLTVAAPGIAARIAPGQFVMLRLAGFDDPLLGRPLALYDALTGDELARRELGAHDVIAVAGVQDGACASRGDAGAKVALEVVYLVQGKLTTRLARYQAGHRVELWGPLGNGFAPARAERLVMVAGGIGQTPFLALAREALGLGRYGRDRAAARSQAVTLCYGARHAGLLACVEDFVAAGVDVRLATDDGSRGHHGLVTDLLKGVLDESPDRHVVACGPEPMLAAVASLAAERGATCEVSLETPMACGIGICFSCVTRVKDDTPLGWDYRRTCVEGPVFDGSKIVW